MWIFLPRGYVSVANAGGDRLMIRARRRKDLSENFPEKTPVFGAGTDYPWRIFMTKEEFALAMFDKIENLNYDNFKDTISPKDPAYRLFAAQVWYDSIDLEIPRHEPQRKKSSSAPRHGRLAIPFVDLSPQNRERRRKRYP